MKKYLLMMTLALLGGVTKGWAVDIYMKAGTNWSNDGAIFKLYIYDSDGTAGNTWVDFSEIDGFDGYYKATISDPSMYDKMIFVRMNPGDTEKTYWERRWNQSWTMESPSENTIYYVYDDAGGVADTGDGFNYNSETLAYKLVYGTTKSSTGYAVDFSPTANEGEFSYTFDNQTSPGTYWFMILSTSFYDAENKAPNSGDWSRVLFTTGDGEDYPQSVTYSTGQGGTLVNTSWTRWKIDAVPAKFTFTFNRLSAVWSITPYFERTLPAAAEGYGTFSSEYDVLIPDGLTAKYATGATGTTINWETYPATGIKANNGALLQGVAGQTYQFKPASAAVAPATNRLEAATTAKANFKGDAGFDCYILTKKTVDSDAAPLCFYKVNSTTGNNILAGTAYLKLPAGGGAREFYNLFGDDVTGIDAVEKTQELGTYYNLAGQRVNQPTKGLYIVNGKKYVVK